LRNARRRGKIRRRAAGFSGFSLKKPLTDNDKRAKCFF